MMRAILTALALAMAVSQADAQTVNGPPIPPDLILRQQNAPLAVPPNVPVPATPAPSTPYGSGPSYSSPRSGPGSSRDRVAECRHQAAVERVPRSKRAAYVHNCMID